MERQKDQSLDVKPVPRGWSNVAGSDTECRQSLEAEKVKVMDPPPKPPEGATIPCWLTP